MDVEELFINTLHDLELRISSSDEYSVLMGRSLA